LFVFGFIAAINWDYESKLVTLDNNAPDWSGIHLGQIVLAIALGQTLIACFLLFLLCLFWPKSYLTWFLAPLTLVTILLIFPSLFIVILGPAGITMVEQMRPTSK
jgi:hypothetical protein